MDKVSNHLHDRVPVYAFIWIISYIGCLLAIKMFSLPPKVDIIVVIIPILTFSVFVYKFYRSIFFMDEVQIKLQMEAFVFAFVFSLLLVMSLGLLDLVFILNKEDWSYRHLVPIFIIFYFIGLFISKRKYNFTDEKHD
ncbi:MAG: hypothetical protein MUC49_19225 [Raineya sp.]|jgi:hypothetical protein|nr:hypothetical protein [Raineya sp.]